jgi:hypothetical protein
MIAGEGVSDKESTPDLQTKSILPEIQNNSQEMANKCKKILRDPRNRHNPQRIRRILSKEPQETLLKTKQP